jgi:hypothetical protein
MAVGWRFGKSGGHWRVARRGNLQCFVTWLKVRPGALQLFLLRLITICHNYRFHNINHLFFFFFFFFFSPPVVWVYPSFVSALIRMSMVYFSDHRSKLYMGFGFGWGHENMDGI